MLVRRFLPLQAALLGVLLVGSSSQEAVGIPHRAVSGALFVTTSGSDSSPCTRTRPCRSFDRAYRRARPGATVFIAAGTYADQRVGVDAAKTSGRDVVFRPLRRGAVHLDKLLVEGRHITFSRLVLRHYWHVEPGAEDVTFRNVRTGVFAIRSARKISVIGGRVGPWDSNDLGEDAQIGDWERSSPQPRQILIDGVTFRDFTNHADPSAHTDCLQFMAGIDVIDSEEPVQRLCRQ